MSVLTLQDITVRLSVPANSRLRNLSHLVLKASSNGVAMDQVNLLPREPSFDVWNADQLLLLHEMDEELTISVLREINEGEGQVLASVEIDGPTLYDSLGTTFEIPLISRRSNPTFVVTAVAVAMTIDDLRRLDLIEDTTPNQDDTANTIRRSAFNSLLEFERHGKLEDLDKGISQLESVIQMRPENAPELPATLNVLAASLQFRFMRLGNLVDIDRAIQRQQAAADLTLNSHPDKATYLNSLGNLLNARFQRAGNPSDIQNAVAQQKIAVDLTKDNHPDKAERLSSLGASLLKRFSRSHNISDVNDAVIHQQAAVNLTPDTHRNKARYLNNLGTSLQMRFNRLGNTADIDNAIVAQQAAVKLLPDNHPDKPTCLSSLGSCLQSRFRRFGIIEDIDQAIVQKQAAVDLILDGHPHKPACLNNLGTCLQMRFLRFGNLSDINNAIAQKQAAVDLTPEGHTDRPLYLSNLGNSLERRFERLGHVVDLDVAIARKREAVELAPDDHHEKHRYLSNLGKALGERYERFGSIVDVDDAIRQYEAAVNLIPDDHVDKPMFLSNYGNAFRSRFERLNNIADLDKAITQQRAAVSLTSDDHPDKPMFLTNLGISLHKRFERLSHVQDINDAVSLKQAALILLPARHPSAPAYYTNLGVSLSARFLHLGDITDLDDAIKQDQAAVDLTPDDHSSKSQYLNNLGTSIERRFDRLGNIEDLDSIISQQRQAVELTPDEHSSKALYSMNLGRFLLKRFQRLQNSEDAETSISSFSAAASSSVGPPLTRFAASQMWISTASLVNHPSLMNAYECALEVMPLVAWLGLPIADRHQYLAKIGGTTREAAATAIALEKYDKAIEWLEQGRSIVWNQILQLRSPVDQLRDVHPELADRLVQISRLLDHESEETGFSDEKQLSAEEKNRRYRALTTERDLIIEKVRSMPDFGEFLKSPSISKLMGAAQRGPVVILNVAKKRCDALAILPGLDEVIHIPLPNISNERLTRLQMELKDILSSSGIRTQDIRAAKRMDDGNDEDDCKHILAELWNDLVNPILECLAFSPHPDALPRIWWCPTGPLAFLPIHAAGIYQSKSVDAQIANYVISSYTPTLSALLESATTSGIISTFKLLAVAEPSAPGASYIPNTKIELAHIQRHLHSRDHTVFEGPEATKENVITEMGSCNWVHFACHGVQNQIDPTKSALLLHDVRLTLEEIIRLDLPQAEFAFLSACQTITGDESISEEAAHIAGGMLLAGYRSVVATMWSIQDDLAPGVTDDFYDHIMGKEGRPSSRNAAEALHYSLQKLRRTDVALTSWIPFVHVGI